MRRHAGNATRVNASRPSPGPLAQQMLALLAAIALCSGCSVQQSNVKRGPLLQTTKLSEHSDKSYWIDFTADDVASIRGNDRVCSDYRHEYAVVDEQVVAAPQPEKLLFGLALVPVGAGVAYGGWHLEDDALKVILGVTGVMLTALGIVGTVSSLTEEHNQYTYLREVALEQTEQESTTECVDNPLHIRAKLPWKVAFHGDQRSGETEGSGEVDLRPAMYSLIQERSLDHQLMKSTAGGAPVTFQVALGDELRTNRALQPDTIPELAWSGWGERYEKRIAGSWMLRWKSCGAVTLTERDRFNCQFGAPEFSARLLQRDGQLEAVEDADGYYGGATEFHGERGQAFSYFVLPPTGNADWFVRIIELQSGAVIEEAFTGSTELYRLSGVFPNTGEYAAVLAARAGGKFESIVAFTPPSASTSAATPMEAQR